MKPYLMEHPAAAAATSTIPVVTLAWLVAVPATMSLGTLSATVAIAVGAGVVAFRTWRSSQATGTVGQMINEAEAGPAGRTDGRA